MRSKNYITRFVTGLLLAVFVLAITPKRFVHDIVATHTDTKPVTCHDHPYQLSATGYNCSCDNFVAESNFFITSFNAHCNTIQVHKFYISQPVSFFSTSSLFYESRGPPFTILKS